MFYVLTTEPFKEASSAVSFENLLGLLPNMCFTHLQAFRPTGCGVASRNTDLAFHEPSNRVGAGSPLDAHPCFDFKIFSRADPLSFTFLSLAASVRFRSGSIIW